MKKSPFPLTDLKLTNSEPHLCARLSCVKMHLTCPLRDLAPSLTHVADYHAPEPCVLVFQIQGFQLKRMG
jgi:hypothetical protein